MCVCVFEINDIQNLIYISLTQVSEIRVNNAYRYYTGN